MKIFQRGFNFSQDGPGNRLVYHISGCNMRCLWCSNPEGMTVSESAVTYTPEQIIADIESCRPMFFSGGGVTFTGGECTLNSAELIETLKALQERGIHTALETNGTSEGLPEILKYTDYLMMDFKHFDDDILRKYTGIDGKAIRKNFEYICKSGRQCHIRIPLIQEFNGLFPDGFAGYFSRFPTENIVFEFLRYHEFGKHKWQEEYKITDGFVTDETVENFIEAFNKHNLKLIQT